MLIIKNIFFIYLHLLYNYNIIYLLTDLYNHNNSISIYELKNHTNHTIEKYQLLIIIGSLIIIIGISKQTSTFSILRSFSSCN